MSNLRNNIYKFVVENTEDYETWPQNNAMEISNQLNCSRNLISQYLNEFWEKGFLGKIASRPVLFFKLPQRYSNKKTFKNIKTAKLWNDAHSLSPLNAIIGSERSLYQIISQIKAAIQYPPNGLPILITGETGTGKSYLAQVIYKHLQKKGFIAKESKFVSVNCSEYSNNPELFLSNFFGYVKGAFTGATQKNKGLAEIANGGVLFLDEIHSLSKECQEKLFQFMDTGSFHKLGDNENWFKSNCRFIFATSKTPEGNLLPTLLRRIPVKVLLPSFNKRSGQEKKELIQFFFKEEQKKICKKIFVTNNLVEFLMHYSFHGNVGDLKNVIQLSCANALIQQAEKQELKITLMQLPKNVDFEKYKEISSYKNSSFIEVGELIQNDQKNSVEQIISDLYSIDITKKGDEKLFDRYKNYFKKRFINIPISESESLNSFFGLEFQQFTRHIEIDYKIDIDTFFYKIILYLFDINNYHYEFRKIEFQEWSTFKKDVSKLLDYEIGLLREFKNEVELTSNEGEELLFIILFKLMVEEHKSQKRLSLIVAHGINTASSISQTVNTMVGDYIFDSIDMPLNITSEEIAIRVNNYLNKRKNFEDLLLLVDMGSLEKISSQLEISDNKNFALITNVSTGIALDVANQIKLKIDTASIVKNVKNNQTIEIYFKKSVNKQDMIVCTCESGLGTAIKLKHIMEKSFPKNSRIVIDSFDYYSIAKENYISELRKNYNILFIVGTLDPKIDGVTFFSIEDLILGINVKKITDKLSVYFDQRQLKDINNNILKNFSLTNLTDQLTILNPTKLLEQVTDAIYVLQTKLNLSLKNNTCFGLYIHICCLIERLVMQKGMADEINLSKTNNNHFKRFYKAFKNSFTVVEQYYSVEIPEIEVKYVYDYIKEA